MAETSRTRDIVVIGGSAGGLEALQYVLGGLPPHFPAAVFVTLHIGPVSYLPQILGRACALPVLPARSGDPIDRGKVYVAVPDVHVLLHAEHVLLRRGPRENLTRPAIDPLFRSAAASLRGRVIGVLLSGSLSDGTAGLRAIKRCGGLAVVQEPDDAIVPLMPESALRHVDVDYVRPAVDIAGLLDRLVREPAGPDVDVPTDIRLEAAIAAQELADMKVDDMIGTPSRLTCPECGGALWEIEDGSLLRYRCHVGHAFGADAVLSAQGEEIEKTLEKLQRAHQERAALARKMAERQRIGRRHNLAEQLEARARGYEEDAALVQELIRTGFGGAGDATREGSGDPAANGTVES